MHHLLKKQQQKKKYTSMHLKNASLEGQPTRTVTSCAVSHSRSVPLKQIHFKLNTNFKTLPSLLQ